MTEHVLKSQKEGVLQLKGVPQLGGIRACLISLRNLPNQEGILFRKRLMVRRAVCSFRRPCFFRIPVLKLFDCITLCKTLNQQSQLLTRVIHL